MSMPAPRPRPKTKIEFIDLLRLQRRQIIATDYAVKPCSCGDVNCLGWRLVSEREPDVRSSMR